MVGQIIYSLLRVPPGRRVGAGLRNMHRPSLCFESPRLSQGQDLVGNLFFHPYPPSPPVLLRFRTSLTPYLRPPTSYPGWETEGDSISFLRLGLSSSLRPLYNLLDGRELNTGLSDRFSMSDKRDTGLQGRPHALTAPVTLILYSVHTLNFKGSST